MLNKLKTVYMKFYKFEHTQVRQCQSCRSPSNPESHTARALYILKSPFKSN